MKKIMTIMAVILICCFNSQVSFAEENQKITDNLSEIWLSPTEEAEVLENLYKTNEKKIEETVAQYLLAPDYALQKIGISTDDETMKEQVREIYSVNENEILKVYHTNGKKYLYQYANDNDFRYLISEDYYLFSGVGTSYLKYEMNGDAFDYKNEDFSVFGMTTITKDVMEFLKNEDALTETFADIDISGIEDVKVIALNPVCTCLYVDCDVNEYIVCLYMGMVYEYADSTYYKWIKNIEPYKLYNTKEFMQIISDEADVMNSVKPTYETEALSLQESGLLQRNENGLDLLKPLSRAEAATMLLRAMGESTTSETQVQTFSDVPSSHWSYGAVENAYNLGLIEGIGDNLFAPEDNVTAEQFSTMILRASEYGEFDWKEALNILINEGVISSEEAATMDFFTRGDMAKIIYEAKEHNFFD